MNKRSIFQHILTGLIFLGIGTGQAFSEELSGRVYDGAVGVETTPISGVTVTLYGSNNSGSLGNVLTSTTTNSSGWYSVSTMRAIYEYYVIVETDPSGYNSTGAKSVSGSVLTSNRIQYTYPLDGLTFSGNKFYDQKPQTSANSVVADAGGPYSNCGAGCPIPLYGAGSYDPDAGDYIVLFEWQVTLNSNTWTLYSGSQSDITWVPPVEGQGTATLKVTDNHGAQDTDTATITVSEDDEETGAITGRKFNDENGNHQKDSGEQGISGWQIALYDDSGAVTYAATGSDGTFSFTGLEEGTYTVDEVSQSGWQRTYPPSPGTYTVEVAGGQAVSDINFGNIESDNPEQPTEDPDYGDAPSPYPEASAELGGPWFGDISDMPDAESGTLRDANALGDDNDGQDDEKGLTLSAYYSKGQIGFAEMVIINSSDRDAILSVWVDWNGDGLWTGDRIYTATCPASTGMSQTIALSVPITAVTGITFLRMRTCFEDGPWSSEELSPDGQSGPGEIEDYKIEIREGDTPTPPGGNIFGTKFNDENGNGIWDPGEPALSGWEFWLDMNGNGIQDAGDQIMQSDAGGHFLFSGLDYKDYLLGEAIQPGWVQTCPGGNGTYAIHLVNMAKISEENGIKQGYLFGNHETDTPGGGEGALKWFQPPLFNPEKFGEKCYYGWGEPVMEGMLTLADDWFCYSPRPVTSITWWGTYAGWKSDVPPEVAPRNFRIGLWTHAAIEEGEFRHPDRMIREWFVERSALDEQADRDCRMPEWIDSEADTCFRYTLSIPEPEWFRQESDSAIYWLSITAIYTEPPAEHVWGWLTRELFFNSNAVRILVPAVPHPDSLYHIGEPLPPYWDMAFILGTDENTAVMDFGDAADGFGTTFSHNAALHLVRHDVRLGPGIDAENDGMPDPGALSDDNNGSDDEDGVVFLSDLIPGTLAEAAVSTSAHGFLNAWLDRNHNGIWDPGEQVLYNMEMPSGNQVVRFPVADEAVPGSSAIRFRFSTMPDVWAKGFAPDGEVEDYEVEISLSTGVEKCHSMGPDCFRLYPNYPNPFNPSTTIRFDLPGPDQVRLSIHNLLGQEIAVLVNERCAEGSHEVKWNGLNTRHLSVPTGMYLVRLETGSFLKTGKLLLIK